MVLEVPVSSPESVLSKTLTPWKIAISSTSPSTTTSLALDAAYTSPRGIGTGGYPPRGVDRRHEVGGHQRRGRGRREQNHLNPTDVSNASPTERPARRQKQVTITSPLATTKNATDTGLLATRRTSPYLNTSHYPI